MNSLFLFNSFLFFLFLSVSFSFFVIFCFSPRHFRKKYSHYCYEKHKRNFCVLQLLISCQTISFTWFWYPSKKRWTNKPYNFHLAAAVWAKSSILLCAFVYVGTRIFNHSMEYFIKGNSCPTDRRKDYTKLNNVNPTGWSPSHANSTRNGIYTYTQYDCTATI